MAVVNQKYPAKTVWKESSICTKTWNNSVLQFMKVSDMLEAEAGFLVRDTVVFVCEILDCCPWFEFSDLEVSGCCLVFFSFFFLFSFIGNKYFIVKNLKTKISLRKMKEFKRVYEWAAN